MKPTLKGFADTCAHRASLLLTALLVGCGGGGGGGGTTTTPPSTSTATLQTFTGPVFVNLMSMVSAPGSPLFVLDAQGVKRVDAAANVTTMWATSIPSGTLAADNGSNAYVLWQLGCGGVVPSVCTAQGGATRLQRVAPDGAVATLPVPVERYDPSAAARLPNGDIAFTAPARNTVYRWTPAGTVEVLVAESGLLSPTGIATDGNGMLYVADGSGSVRRIDPATRAMTTVGRFTVSGNAALSRYTVAAASDGRVYVADQQQAIVMKVQADGSTRVLVGMEGQPGFIAGPLPARIGPPVGLALIGADLFIAYTEGATGAIAVVRNVP